jgi:hypothetical protein
VYDERGDQKSFTVVHALGFEDVLRDLLVGAFWLHLVFFLPWKLYGGNTVLKNVQVPLLELLT